MCTHLQGRFSSLFNKVEISVHIYRQDLGTAMGVKRGCLMVMVREHEDYKELYDELTQEITGLPPPVGVSV